MRIVKHASSALHIINDLIMNELHQVLYIKKSISFKYIKKKKRINPRVLG